MSDDGPWLNVPQAVVLEATRDIELVLGLTETNPALLVIRANQLIALRTEIPLEPDADNEQRGDAFRKFHESKAAMQAGSQYLEAQERARRRLVLGVRTKARRAPGGRYESVDPVEYTGAELQGMDAIDKRTRTVILCDLRIHAFDFVENLTGNPVRPAGSLALGQMRDRSPQKVEKWEYTGDPVPKLID